MKIIQRFQSKILRLVTNAPWYVSKFTFHNDLKIPFVIEEIHRFSTLYHQSVLRHNNRLVAENSNPPNARRRLRRQWPSDLPQHADEKRAKVIIVRHRTCKSIISGWFLHSRHLFRANLLITSKTSRVYCNYAIYKLKKFTYIPAHLITHTLFIWISVVVKPVGQSVNTP
jgi:hypothetical protein